MNNEQVANAAMILGSVAGVRLQGIGHSNTTMNNESQETGAPMSKGVGGRRALRRWRMIVLGLILCAAVLHPRAAAQKPRGRFSKDEIIDLLKSGVTSARIAGLARQFGISFELTPETKSELSGAGGTPELLKALGEVAPKPPPPPAYALLVIEATPAGAEVYIDGEQMGKTGTDGRLEQRELRPGEHIVRLVLAGYQNYEQKVDLVAGQRATVSKSLEAVKSAASPAPGPGSATTAASFRVVHLHWPGQSAGILTIGNGRIEFRPNAGNDFFGFSLSDVEDAGRLRGGFSFRVKTGKKHKKYEFFSEPDALPALQRAMAKH